MSEHLTKAKGALERASELDVDLASEAVPKAYSRLLDLASVQAQVAQAEALEGLVRLLMEAGVGLRPGEGRVITRLAGQQ